MDKIEKIIENLYYKEQHSIMEISEKLDIHHEKVRKILHDLKGTRTKKEAAMLRGEKRKGYNDLEERTKRMRSGYEKQMKTGELSIKYQEQKQGEKNLQSKLTENEVLKIREEFEELSKDKWTKRQIHIKLAEKYKVNKSTISSIIRKDTWKHV